MNDYKELRDALAADPIEGPWVVGNTDQTLFGRPMHPGTEPIGFVYAPAMPEKSAYGRKALATSAYIAAADPTTIRQLLADIDAARADAARYRQLRSGPKETHDSLPSAPWAVRIVHEYGLPTVTPCYGPDLDAAIDAAIGKGA